MTIYPLLVGSHQHVLRCMCPISMHNHSVKILISLQWPSFKYNRDCLVAPNTLSHISIFMPQCMGNVLFNVPNSLPCISLQLKTTEMSRFKFELVPSVSSLLGCLLAYLVPGMACWPCYLKTSKVPLNPSSLHPRILKCFSKVTLMLRILKCL